MASLAIQSRHWNLGGKRGTAGLGQGTAEAGRIAPPSPDSSPQTWASRPRPPPGLPPHLRLTVPSLQPLLSHPCLPKPLKTSSIPTSPGQSGLSPPSPQNLLPAPRPALPGIMEAVGGRGSQELRQLGLKCPFPAPGPGTSWSPPELWFLHL